MEKLYKYIESQRELTIELQKLLTLHAAINPESDGDGEMEKYNALKNFIKGWGFSSISNIDIPDERVSSKIRPTLIATIDGKIKQNLWIITHLDVVPPGEASLWKTPPYEATVVGDKIYGRGTEDNQQGIVSSLIAAKYFLDNNITPYYTVKLMFVPAEETGSGYGLEWLVEHKIDTFNKDDLIITPDVGDPEGLNIEVAEKSILWMTFKVMGKQSHGSRPDNGINAVRATAYLSVALDSLYDKFNKRDSFFDVPYSTFEPTKRIGSITSNMNTISGEEILGLDCRVLPDYDLKDLFKEIDIIKDSIEKRFGVKITTSIDQELQAPPPTKTTERVVVLLKDSIKTVTGKEAKFIGIGGGTVAAFFRQKRIPVSLWSTVDNTMHSPNEYSSITNTLNDAKVFAVMMLDNK